MEQVGGHHSFAVIACAVNTEHSLVDLGVRDELCLREALEGLQGVESLLLLAGLTFIFPNLVWLGVWGWNPHFVWVWAEPIRSKREGSRVCLGFGL